MGVMVVCPKRHTERDGMEGCHISCADAPPSPHGEVVPRRGGVDLHALSSFPLFQHRHAAARSRAGVTRAPYEKRNCHLSVCLSCMRTHFCACLCAHRACAFFFERGRHRGGNSCPSLSLCLRCCVSFYFYYYYYYHYYSAHCFLCCLATPHLPLPFFLPFLFSCVCVLVLEQRCSYGMAKPLRPSFSFFFLYLLPSLLLRCALHFPLSLSLFLGLVLLPTLSSQLSCTAPRPHLPPFPPHFFISFMCCFLVSRKFAPLCCCVCVCVCMRHAIHR